MLGHPDFPGLRMNGQALRAAMSVGPYLRQGVGTADKRIVRRHPPIVVQANDLALVVREHLRGVTLLVLLRRCLAIAHGEKEVTLPIERDAPAVVTVCLAPCLRFEDLFDVDQAIALESRSQEGRRGLLA